MSFTDDFLNGLEKRKVKQSLTKESKTDYSQYDDYTRDFLTSLEKRKKKKEEEEERVSFVEDIAPVRSDRGKADLLGLDLFQESEGDVLQGILGTVGDLGLEVFKGIGGLAEGIVDATGYLLAGGADLLGADDVARKMRKTTSKSQMDQLTGGADDFLEKYSYAGNTLDAVAQGVGQVGTLIGTGGLASTGLGATLLTTGLMGASGVGSGMSEAYESGASDDEALTYGLISGASDAFTELIFGGLGKGVNALGFGRGLSSADDMLAKAVSSKFKSTVAKNVAEFGIKAGAEGLEEVLAGTLQAAGKKATYMSEEDFGKILEDENLFEQFIVGAMTSGIAQAGSVKTSIKTGQDFITGLTQNEQTVVDSLYESEIADKNLDKKEKQKIYDQILTKLDKGYIGIEDIERTLGGETYKAYKETSDSEKALRDKLTASQKEYSELKDIHFKNRTEAQNNRLAELETEIKNLEAQVNETTANSKLGEMKSQLSKQVFELTKNDTKLQESYREEMRRGQDLELDVEQYKGAAKITAQNLLKGGMNNTNRVHDVADFLTKISADKNIVFDVATAKKLADAGLSVDGRQVNGLITKDGIVLNLESSAVLETTVGHEITHALEGTEHYEVLKSVIKEYAELKGVYADKYSSLENIYAKKDANGNILKDENGNIVWVRDDVDIDSEIVADLVGEYLFTDADFINNLSVKHRNVFQKIYDEIKYLCKIATAGSDEARKLEEVKRAFDKAYKEDAEVDTAEFADSEVKYSIREEAPPKETGIAYKVFFVKDGKLYPPMVANPDGADTPMGVWLNADVGKSAPPSKTGRQQVKAGGKGTQGGGGSLAFRPGWHLGDLPRASQFDRVNPETGKKELFPENFVWAEVEYAKDVDYQEEAMSYGYTENGKFRHAYAGLPRLPENGYYRYRTNPKPDTVPWIITGAMKVNRLLSDAEVNEILEKNGVEPVHRQGGDVGLDKFGIEGDVKYSLSERKTLYTGSPVTDIQQFKVGGANGAKQTGDRYGRGIYLTTNKTTAKGYAGDSGRVYEINADDLNIFDLNDPITEEMKATLHRELNGKDKQFRNSVLRNFRSEKTFTDFESAEQFFDEQRKAWKEEDGYYSANKPDIKSADDKTGIAVIEYTDFVNIDNAIGNLTGNQLYDALKSISTDDFASFITGHGFDGIAFDEDADNQQYVIYRNEDRLHINDDVRYSLSDSEGRQLSKEQSEYFKDSKVVDENGNLLVMYHGTPNGDYSVFKSGTYFTANKEYADRYQNPGASSISTGKTASAPKTFEVYLDIKKPFDLNDAEARRIYIEDYIKGGNALGINPYLSDAEYEKITTIDWTEGEDLRDFLIDNGYDYDGLVLDEGADGGYGDDVKSRGNSYVIFNPEQVKNVDNAKPTSDPDIRFSLSEAVEETKDLVAVHNLQSSELLRTINLGGLPMPSIAVIKAQQGHEQYGDVSLIFPKDTIDPKARKENKVYGGDAWTPTYPRIEYKPNKAVSKRIKDKYYELAEKIGYDAVRPLQRYTDELESALNSDGGEAGMLDRLYADTKMMQVYLEDSGKGKVEPIVKETRTEATEAEREMNQWFIDRLGEDVIRAFKAPAGVSPFSHRQEFMAQYGELAENAYRDLLVEKYDFSREEVEGVLDNTDRKDILRFIRNAEMYLRNGGVTVKEETDYDATEKAITAKAEDGYKEWVDNLFKGVEEKSGIRNNVDYFTNSGNRRSWDALHWENTLENVVKVMKAQDQTGADAFAPSSALFAVANKQYGSIADIKADSNRLGKVTEEEYEELKEEYSNRLAKIADSIKDPGERNPFIATDRAAEEIIDAVRTQKTKSGMLRYMQKWNSRVTESIVDDIVSLVSDIANMPTGYFEAKPQRAVGLDEVGVFVIPNNTDVKLKQELLGRGYSIAEYDPNVEGDRNRVVNQYEEYKFSLSDPNDIAPTDFRKSAKYLMVDKSKAQDFGDIAPTQKRTDAPVATDDEEIKAEDLVDRDSFVVRRAKELYEEITNLKKGVRASKSLGYLLDHGHEWRSIKTALLNIRDNPNQVVNENSAAESVAREMLGREYDEMVYELNEQTDVAESVRIKMNNIQTEIANNERLREQASMDYDAEIAEVQAKYDAKKNKNTIEANNLLRRIERLNRMKNTNDANYAKRIGDLEARLEKMSQPTYKTAVQRRKKQSEYTTLMESLVGDTSTWVDKKLGISYKVNTLRRNLRDIVRDASGNQDIAKADAIYDELQGNYNRHEAALKRESKKLKSVFADMKLTSAEDTYAHMLGEFRHNPDSKLTEERVKEYYEQHKKDIDTAKVDKAIEEARKTFDELIARVNEKLREQGMKEIPYRKGYFPHFTNPKQGILAKLFNWKPVDHEIPTSIAGITETFNPERSWQSFNKERKSDITDYSLAQGLDTYIHGSLDWIYHIEDIQKRRALENHIRYIHSEEGVKAKINEIRNSEELDADEMQDRIDLVYAEANNPLNNFVTDLRAGTNTLAAKKSSMDRALEEKTNRKIYSVMTNLNNRVSANMVVGSVSSALTNFIPIVQSWVEVSPMYSLRGMGDTIRATARDDGIINKSTFLTNRLIEEEKLYKTGWDKASDKAAILMNAIDSFTSQTVWRSRYLQNISEGMSEIEAIHNADQFAENVIAGRSRGNMPTIFDAKNPITKIFTAFQLEVSNQYGYMFKDAPTDSKNKARLVKGFATMFIGSYLYNALYSSLVGRNAAFDPLSIIEDLLGDFEDDEEEEAIVNLANNVIEEIPFVGSLFGGGRIPISSALPYSGEYEGLSKFASDISEENWENVGRELLQPLYYLIMPFGGGQIKKTNEGLGMFSEDHPIAGSYTASGNLRFPVEDNFINRMQAALFGQYSSENARDYFDNNRTALKEKQIQEFIDVDIPIRDYWEYREGLSEQKTLEDKFDYIAGLDLPVAKKNILINNIVDREEAVDLEGYEDFSNYEEFDFAAKNPEKYTVAKAVGGYNSYASYYKAMNDISADKDESGKSITGSRKEKIIDYVNSLDADYGVKIILFKSEYKADDTYNADILDYLNSRDDLTYEEIVTILTELDFTVDANGNVYWD